jgi:hypothetical protein
MESAINDMVAQCGAGLKLVMGNKYSVEHTNLSLNGRSCGSNGLVSSQHDRRFIWSGGEFLKDEAWGNTGACSLQGTRDEPIIDCGSINDGVLQAEECPEKCNFSCNENTSYCDCGSATCKSRQGFVEESAIDLCAAARCEHGRCTATFLGGSLPVTSNACVCDEGWSGPLCQYNPCATTGKTCSGHGKCVALSDTSASCECDQGFSGDNCEKSCDEVCTGDWPYGCARDLDGIERYGCYGAGCYYLRENEKYSNNSVCTYKEDRRQDACICDDQNDCLLTLPCNSDGSCPPSEFVPDATPCNSVPFGQCQSGICQEATNPPPRSTPTNPVSQKVSTVFATEQYTACLNSLSSHLPNYFLASLLTESNQRLIRPLFPQESLPYFPRSKLTAAARSVLKRYGTLLLAMIVWVAVTLAVAASHGLSRTMEAIPTRLVS